MTKNILYNFLALKHVNWVQKLTVTSLMQTLTAIASLEV